MGGRTQLFDTDQLAPANCSRILSGKIFDHVSPNSIDIVWDSDPINPNAARGTLQNTGTELMVMPPGFTPPHALDASAHLIDVNCDGKMELVYFGNGRMEAYTAGPNGWIRADPRFIPPLIPTDTPAAGIRDIPGFNGCPGLLAAVDGPNPIQKAFTTTNLSGWQLDPNHTPNFFFVDANGNDAHAIVTTNPLSAQAVEIVANWQPLQGQSIQFASTLTPAAISTTSNLIPPGPLGRDTQDALGNKVPNYTGFLGDLNSDGWPDVIYFSNSRQMPNQVYTFDPTSMSWAPNDQFNPIVPFAQQKQTIPVFGWWTCMA